MSLNQLPSLFLAAIVAWAGAGPGAANGFEPQSRYRGDRYQQLGYGYHSGTYTPGSWAANYRNGIGFGSRAAAAAYGRYGSYGGYRGWGRSAADLGMEQLHQAQLQSIMKWAPLPERAPDVYVNPDWRPNQKSLADGIYNGNGGTAVPETLENPFVRQH